MSGSGSGMVVTEITTGPSCTPIPAYHPTFIIVTQAFVSVTTVLSILGSVLIVGTFIAFKNLRTRARQILVQLSIADFAVAASQLVGVNVNLQRYASRICTHMDEADINITSDTFCKVQGGLTIFFTISSFFWTVAVAIYLLTVIVFESQRVGRWLTYLSYPVCWGVPAVIVVAFGLRKSIGFHANVDTGIYVGLGRLIERSLNQRLFWKRFHYKLYRFWCISSVYPLDGWKAKRMRKFASELASPQATSL